MDEKTYRKKVLGCWLGKAVGGTLGAPIEGWDGPHHLEFYDPVPTTWCRTTTSTCRSSGP